MKKNKKKNKKKKQNKVPQDEFYYGCSDWQVVKLVVSGKQSKKSLKEDDLLSLAEENDSGVGPSMEICHPKWRLDIEFWRWFNSLPVSNNHRCCWKAIMSWAKPSKQEIILKIIITTKFISILKCEESVMKLRYLISCNGENQEKCMCMTQYNA